MSTERQALMDQIIDMGFDLVLNHDTRPSEITKAISKKLAEHAECLPKLEVLYNDTYGGFEYSDEFETYKWDRPRETASSQKMYFTPVDTLPFMTAGDEEWRILDCIQIRPFGKAQAEKYPIAFATVLHYYLLDMDSLKSAIYKLTFDESDAEERKAAQAACKDLPRPIVEHYRQIINAKPNRRGEDDDYSITLDFSTFIANKTEKDENIWETQYQLDQEIMMSLHKYLSGIDICRPAGSEVHLDQAHKIFGLICASGKSSKLNICEIPQIVEWMIGDYDGLERVCLK